MKSNAPFVSVLMPVYNAQEHLSEAIESILNQTYRNFEFIIINDGSVDSSDEIIKAYQSNDSRIKYYKNECNLKLIKTLNKGVSLCRGKYILRMDADDIALINRFEKQINYMEAYSHCVVCGTQLSYIDNDGNKVRDITLPTDNSKIMASFLFYNPIAHPSVIMRTSIIKENKLQYDEDYLHAEDYKLWVELSKFGDCANLGGKLLKYRVSENQISAKYGIEQKLVASKISNDYFVEIMLELGLCNIISYGCYKKIISSNCYDSDILLSWLLANSVFNSRRLKILVYLKVLLYSEYKFKKFVVNSIIKKLFS
ncbi:glycosyltransferase family 2 protein [Vibrio renipiscarius]|uniref:glycosyltransferase family 2 protein n=1 Tax=Vibrio renipiscarius TaxID=1461322 RepID=UPI00354CF61B